MVGVPGESDQTHLSAAKLQVKNLIMGAKAQGKNLGSYFN